PPRPPRGMISSGRDDVTPPEYTRRALAPQARERDESLRRDGLRAHAPRKPRAAEQRARRLLAAGERAAEVLQESRPAVRERRSKDGGERLEVREPRLGPGRPSGHGGDHLRPR